MQKPGTVPYNYICVIFITIGMYTNGYIASLTTPYKSKTIIYYYRLDTATEDFRYLISTFENADCFGILQVRSHMDMQKLLYLLTTSQKKHFGYCMCKLWLAS